MKNLKVFLLVCIILNPLILSQGMHGISSGNGSIVVSAGKNGIVIRSTDSGRNWTSQVLTSSQLNSVTAIGTKYWICGNNGAFFYSLNSGVTWSNITITAGSNFNSVFFIDSATGWIVGDNGLLLKTTNGGFNWSMLTSTTTSKLNSVKFLNSGTGVACGADGMVIKTTNGGGNWQNISPQSNRELLDCDLKGNRISVTGEYATFFTAPLNGSVWTAIDQKFKTKSDVNGVYMHTENSLFTCGGGGFIRKSDDGGTTYSYPQNPMFGELHKIHFYDQQIGWAISRKTIAVLRTSDGGNSWHLPEGTTTSYTWNRTLQYGYNQCFGDAINTFNPLNKNVIYTLAANKLYRSSDIGETWSHISTLPYAALFSQYLQVSQRDTSKMIALLQYPTRLFYTSNSGTNWVLITSVTAGQVGIPIAVHPINPDTLFYGTMNSLYKSTNFGLNWELVSQLPFSYGVCDIEINHANPSEILINTKSPAKVFRSTNGGINFAMTNSTTTANSESPALTSSIYEPATAYHLFYNTLVDDGIYKSTNFGLNWIKISPVTYLWGIAIAPDDPNIIVAGAWDGIPRPGYISTDKGQSFFETSPLLGEYNGNEAIYIYDKGNILFQQTIGIYKLKVNYTVPAIGIEPLSQEIPAAYSLSQNYPNPFNPATKIKFHIPLSIGASDGRGVLLKIYDVLGKEIAILINEQLKPGIYEIDWNAENLPSGVYFYSLITNEFTQTRKMMVVK